MKPEEIYNELLEIADKLGITVRKDKGKFRGGSCVLNEHKIIVINNSIPLTAKASILAKCLNSFSIENVFIKPAIRNYINTITSHDTDDKNEISLNIDSKN